MTKQKKKLIYILARIQNCWEHHQDGSDLRKTHQSHLFSLIFNDLKNIIKKEHPLQFETRLIKNEKEEIKHILENDYAFKEIEKIEKTTGIDELFLLKKEIVKLKRVSKTYKAKK